jgi:hypothetical protein
LRQVQLFDFLLNLGIKHTFPKLLIFPYRMLL